MSDIVDEAKEDYQDAKQGHESLKDALVNEHGSDTTEVDLGNGITVEVDSSPGMAKVREIQSLAGKLDEDADSDDIMDNFGEWCEGVSTLIVDNDFDADLLMGIAQEDMQAFSEVLSRILEAMDLEQEVNEDTLKSFRGK